MKLEDLQLTEQEFTMLFEALENLPNKGDAGEIMGTMFESMFAKESGENAKDFFAKKRLERAQKEREKILLIENTRILQGKLLMIKRQMQSEGILKQADSIINPGE